MIHTTLSQNGVIAQLPPSLQDKSIYVTCGIFNDELFLMDEAQFQRLVAMLSEWHSDDKAARAVRRTIMASAVWFNREEASNDRDGGNEEFDISAYLSNDDSGVCKFRNACFANDPEDTNKEKIDVEIYFDSSLCVWRLKKLPVPAFADYDFVVSRGLRGREIDYGIKYPVFSQSGASPVLFIKVGQDGSINGYHDKWIHMAERICRQRGIIVIVASNPFDGNDPIGNAMDVIRDYAFEKYGIPEAEQQVYYLGHSNGALAGAWYAHKYPQIRKLVPVNTPLSEKHLEYTIFRLDAAHNNNMDVTLVYGEDDPYALNARLLEVECLPHRTRLRIIENADHHFSHTMDQFMKLPELFWDE